MLSSITFEEEKEERQFQRAIAASLAPLEDVQDAIRASILSGVPSSKAQLAPANSNDEEVQQLSPQRGQNTQPYWLKPACEICDGSQDSWRSKLTSSSLDGTKISQDSSAIIPTPPARRNIDDAILDLQQRSKDLPRLHVAGCDTLVYINPPAKLPDQDDSVYSEIESRYEYPFGVRSATLKALGTSVFDDMLMPTAQYRAQGRRNLRNRLPAHINYVIDLTPPNEGDQAILLVSNLSCSLGVRQWGLSTRRWNVSQTLVGGHDEYTSARHVPEFVERRASGDQKGEKGDAQNDSEALKDGVSDISPGARASPPLGKLPSDKEVKDVEKSTSLEAMDFPPQLPEEYNPTRHRLAIERVLTAIEGLDPKLDSAVKVWTTFAVAQNFGIKHSSLTDYIVRWLRAPPNTYFMEVLPEVTLKIADGLQCEPLCRDIFALLVGEKALAIACQERGYYDKDCNVHGRKKEDLSDGWTTRIEYASEELVTRVKSEFENLVGDMRWVSDLPELHQLRIHSRDSPNLTQAYGRLENLLKEYLRGGIWQSLCLHYTYPKSDRLIGQPGGETLFHSNSFMKTWIDMRPQERIFTRSFWNMIGSSRFRNLKHNFNVETRHLQNSFEVTDHIIAELTDQFKAGIFRRVESSELKTAISAYRTLSVTSSDSSASQSTVRSRLSGWFSSSGDSHHPPNGIDIDQQSPKRRRTETFANDQANLGNQSSGLEYELPIRDHKSAAIETRLFDMEINTSDTPSHSRSPTPLNVNAASPPPSYRDAQASTSKKATSSAPPHRTPIPSEFSSLFDLNTFFVQAESYLAALGALMLSTPSSSSADSFELTLTDTLICLNESELKFLPLWAGGNDDDTAGVFNAEVPIAVSGFSTAGPSVHTGTGSSVASSEFDMLRDTGSSIDTSTVVNDGFSDSLERKRVYDADSTWDEVLAGKDTENSTRTIAEDDATMESQSTWEEVLTPTGEEMVVLGEANEVGVSSEIHEPTGNVGKGKAVGMDDSYDDVFMEDEEPFEFDDDDDLGGEGDALQEEMDMGEETDENAESVYVYREDMDAWR